MKRKDFIKVMEKTRKHINKKRPFYLCHEITDEAKTLRVLTKLEKVSKQMSNVFSKKDNRNTGIFGRVNQGNNSEKRLLAFEFFYIIALEEKLYKEL